MKSNVAKKKKRDYFRTNVLFCISLFCRFFVTVCCCRAMLEEEWMDGVDEQAQLQPAWGWVSGGCQQPLGSGLITVSRLICLTLKLFYIYSLGPLTSQSSPAALCPSSLVSHRHCGREASRVGLYGSCAKIVGFTHHNQMDRCWSLFLRFASCQQRAQRKGRFDVRYYISQETKGL